MADKWMINSAKTVGRSHLREGIPCQDSVASLEKNGVSVIALSDGCGSSPLSHYGSDITVKVLCDLFAEHYDEMYDSDEDTVRKKVVFTIVEQIKLFIQNNSETLAEFKRANPKHYERFKSNWPGFTRAEKIYPITFFDATVQFVAVKDDKVIAGRLGDGVIADIDRGSLRILSSEDKIGVEENATWYPSTVLIASENKNIDPWSNFEIIKRDNASECGMFLIVSDGVAEVIVGEDEEEREKFLYPNDIYNLIKNSDKLFDILEEQYKPLKGIFDDLSAVIMHKPDVKIEELVLRQYDESGRAVANTKTHPIVGLDNGEPSVKESEKDKPFELAEVSEEDFPNLLGEEENMLVRKYVGDDGGYRDFFVKQASKIIRHLEKKGSERLDDMHKLLKPFVDDDDWRCLLKQFAKLDLFVIDVEKGTIRREEN